MYTIGTIIYGRPVSNNEVSGSNTPEALEEWLEENEEEKGLLSYYSGSGISGLSPTAIGVELGEFDECASYIPISKIALEPTQEQMEEFEECWERIPNSIKQLIQQMNPTVTAPFVFVLWSTS